LVWHVSEFVRFVVVDGAAGDFAGAFLIRIFNHLSRLRPWLVLSIARGNDVVGFITGLADVHAVFINGAGICDSSRHIGHLDKRGTGDLWTLTVQEYLESSRWRRFAYRLARIPLCCSSSRRCLF